MVDRPRVTCVMITGHDPERWPYAAWAVEAWRRQMYTNTDLLIINQGELLDIPDDRITEISTAPGRWLSELRNIGVAEATGELVMPWDDDDYCGFRRIANQADAGAPNVLRKEIVVSRLTHEAKVVDAYEWQSGGFPNALLHPRKTAPLYPLVESAEDVLYAARLRGLKAIDNDPRDYVRFYECRNICSKEHFDAMPGRPLTRDESDYLAGLLWFMSNRYRNLRCRSIEDVRRALPVFPVSARQLNAIARGEYSEILEIGHGHGALTCCLAATGARVTSIGMPDTAYFTPSAEDLLSICGLEAEILRQEYCEALADLILEGRRFDLVLNNSGNEKQVHLLAKMALKPHGMLLESTPDDALSSARYRVMDGATAS